MIDMRLIDADVLEKEGWSLHRTVRVDRHTMEYQVKQIAEVPTIEPERKKGKWIPCSERLPEEKINPNTQDYDWVLCSTTFGDVRAYHFGRGRFLHGCGDVTQYVAAWMPMPEPYKEENR